MRVIRAYAPGEPSSCHGEPLQPTPWLRGRLVCPEDGTAHRAAAAHFPRFRTAASLLAAALVLATTACNPVKQLGIPTAHRTGTASPAAHRKHHHDPRPAASPSPSGTFPAGLTAKEKRLIVKVRLHLRSAGMTEHLSNAEVGTLGHAVCVARRNGVTQSQVADAGSLAGARSLFDLSPATFALWAEQAICPRWVPGGAS